MFRRRLPLDHRRRIVRNSLDYPRRQVVTDRILLPDGQPDGLYCEEYPMDRLVSSIRALLLPPSLQRRSLFALPENMTLKLQVAYRILVSFQQLHERGRGPSNSHGFFTVLLIVSLYSQKSGMFSDPRSIVGTAILFCNQDLLISWSWNYTLTAFQWRYYGLEVVGRSRLKSADDWDLQRSYPHRLRAILPSLLVLIVYYKITNTVGLSGLWIVRALPSDFCLLPSASLLSSSGANYSKISHWAHTHA